MFLDAGADAWYITNSEGYSPTMCPAVECGDLSTIELLLNHDNGLLERKGKIYGYTPLLAALDNRRFGTANFLLDRGANALAITNEGSTTLLLACQKGANLGIVRRLLAAGVPVDARDKINCTAPDSGGGRSIPPSSKFSPRAYVPGT